VPHEPRIQQLHNDFMAAGLHPFHLPVGVDLDESDPEAGRCVRCDRSRSDSSGATSRAGSVTWALPQTSVFWGPDEVAIDAFHHAGTRLRRAPRTSF
jgi:hypothetical protein